MKKITRIALTVFLAVLLSVAVLGAVVAAGDGEYTGDVDTLASLVQMVSESEGSELENAIAEVGKYLSKTPVDPDSEGYDGLMQTVYAKAVEYASAKLEISKSASGVVDKFAALTSVSRVILPFDIPESVPGYTAFMENYVPEAEACAQKLIDACDVERGTAVNGVAVNRVKAFAKQHPFILEDEDYKAARDAAVEAQEAAEKELIDGYNASASLSEYSLGVLFTESFDERDPNELYGFTQKINAAGKNTIVGATEGDNGYLALDFYESLHSYIRTDLPAYDQGTVIEFDITTFTSLPRKTVEIAASSATALDGTRYYPSYGRVGTDGKLSSAAKLNTTGNTTILENAIVPGEWLHISMVFHQATGLIDYYVNYQYMGSGDGSSGHPGYHNLKCFRIGSVNTGSNCESDAYDGGFGIDNFTVYQGNCLRSVDLFDTMNDGDRFLYYVNYLSLETATAPEKKVAYDMASSLIDEYWRGNTYLTENAELRAAVDEYLAFDYDALYAAYCAEKLNEFVAMIENFETIGRTLDNRDDREAALALITAFLDGEGKDILKNDVYTDNFNKYKTFEAYIVMDEKVENFCVFVDRIYLAFAATPMQKHYDFCTELLVDIDLNLTTAEGFEYFAEQYVRYLDADEELQKKIATENAKKIVECVQIIIEYDTVEEWEENYEFVNKYVVIIRESMKSGNVDASYEGLEEALAFYETVNAYFYDKLQQAHIALISEQLERFVEAESYIEKMGICAYLNAYFANPANDIDMTNPAIISLKRSIDIYNAEMGDRKEDYKYILAQNTVFFANAIEKMRTATDYTSKKAYFDEATGYYYAMNVGDESIASHLAEYDNAAVELVAIKEASDNFVIAVEALKNILNDEQATDDDLYAAVVDCYVYRATVALDIEGVSEATEVFDAKYAAYVETANVANTEIAQTGEALFALRSNSGTVAILSTLYRLVFEK